MELLRTPDERFACLPGMAGQPFAPHWLDDLPGVEGVRIHYLDTAPADASRSIALCLHGNPTWCYLYRRMLPGLARAGFRVVAPDLAGFGRSDKPVDAAWHAFERHRQMLLGFVERLDLARVSLVVQDWGGLLGLTLPMAAPARYERLLAMNTAFATGEIGDGFRAWRAYSERTPDLPVGALLARGKPDMTAGEIAAYDAPFPDARYKAALRAFPALVPDAQRGTPADRAAIALSLQARDWFARDWTGESFVACGMQDPVFSPPTMRAFAAGLRGAPGLHELPHAGHFVQEWGESVVDAALARWGLA